MRGLIPIWIAFVALTVPQRSRGETPSARERAFALCREQMRVGEGGITAAFTPVLKSLASPNWQRNREALDILRELTKTRLEDVAEPSSPFAPDAQNSTTLVPRCFVRQSLLRAAVPALDRLLRRTTGLEQLEVLAKIESLDLGADAAPLAPTLMRLLSDALARPAAVSVLRRLGPDADPRVRAALTKIGEWPSPALPPPPAPNEPLAKAAVVDEPLAKSAVVDGMNLLKPKVAACYAQFQVQGAALVNVVIAASGKVSRATVTGRFAGTPTGACVEAAVRTGTFPQSQGLTTTYPFELK